MSEERDQLPAEEVAPEAINDRSPSPDRDSRKRSVSRSPRRSASRSPVRASVSRSPSRSRSPVKRARSRSRGRDRSCSRSPVRRRRSRSDSRDRHRRRRSPSRDYHRRKSPPRYGRRSPPPAPRNRRTPPTHGLHLFVAGINFMTTEREMERKFDKYGDVDEVRIVRNPHNGESRGFGFVIMKNESGADEAIRALDGAEWQGRRLLVERARNIR